VIVQNAEHYTYFNERELVVAEGAVLDSGTLAGVVLRRARLIDMPTLIFRALGRRARIVRHRQIVSFEDLAAVTVTTADGRGLPLHVDGDYIGDVNEAQFEVHPRALTVVS
jgi:diacylglycerol kinase family enzyme